MSEQLIPTPGPFGENDNFLLERELGQGGMGGVYMGRDKMLDRPVAVKVMLKEYGDDAEFVGKFKKEAQAVARLIHPNIAQVYSYGICQGMPYIAMELASGGSLYTIMQANPGKTDVARVIKICQQTAQALQCASDQGCVHGDVKPENILLDANGNAKLVDFGLAAMQKETDEIWGTPYYISPEKVQKEPIDFRADMYSLGGTLYHALTGVAPFEGDDAVAVVKKRFEGAPKKPSEIRPDLTDAIDDLVMRMLALKKEDRFPSFEALLEAFKNVLTTGLAKNEAATASAPATTTAKRPTTGTGTRRMMVRGRRTTMMKRTTTVKKTAPTTVEGEPPPEGTDENAVEPIEGENTGVAEGEAEKGEKGAGEEEGGNLGVKITLVIIGIIVAIGAIVGGLVWYRIADKNARAAEAQAQIVAAGNKAREAITETVASAKKFADEFDAFAAKAIEEAEKPTAELMKILPEAQAQALKPGPSKELLDAIAATNDAPKAVEAPAPAPAPAGTNAAPTAATTGTNAAPAKAAAPAGTNAAPAKAATPAGTNAAPAKAAAPAPAKPATPAPAKPATKPAAPATAPASTNAAPASSSADQAVVAMHELWERAYSCQASAVRIRHQVRQIIKKGAEVDALTGNDRTTVEKLAELSRNVVDMLEAIKTSKDVENVRKGITLIRQKGEKTVKNTITRLRIEKQQNDRKAKQEAAAAAEKARLEKIENERKATIEAESNAAKEKFETIAAQGSLRQLDWKNALRQIETLKAEFTTPEGQHAADVQLHKVKAMQCVHEIFIKSMKGFTFKGKPLKGLTVSSVNEKDIQLKKKKKITWQKFYKDHPGNLNELINTFVIHGRDNAKPRLNLKTWAEAMTGAALTLQIVCSEVNGATEKSQSMAKEAASKFSENINLMKEIFPDIEFEAAASTEE